MRLSGESVECIKSVDLSNDFSNWHIKWTVGVITENELGNRRYSPDFQIPPPPYKFNDTSLIDCSLSMRVSKDDPNIMGIRMKIWSIKFPTPMVYRFALSSNGPEMLLTNAQVDVGTDGDELLVFIDGSMFKRKSNLIWPLVLHCWLDIPSAMIKKLEEKSWESIYHLETVPFNISNFLKRSEALYKSTMDPNRDFTSHSDVTLILSGKLNGRFYCHRDILASASPVFATMFSTTQWKEGEDGTVEIDDIDVDMMQAVLYHIYTGQFKEAESIDLPNLIYAADKYQLKDLKVWAEIQMMAVDCTDSELVDYLLLAERHQLYQLRAACIVMLSTNLGFLLSDDIKEKFSEEARKELMKAVEKRQVNTTHISI